MRRRSTATTLLLAGLALPVPGAATVGVPETEILNQVALAYQSLGNFIVEGTLHVEIKGPTSQTQDLTFLVAAGSGGRVRDEIFSPTQGGMIVSDGRETIVYNGALGQYTRRPGNPDSLGRRMPNRGIGAALMERYRVIENGATSARRMPDTTLTLEGVDHPCYVLEVGYPSTTGNAMVRESPRMYWIDQATYLVLRQQTVISMDAPQVGGKVEQREDVTLHRATLDPRLPDSLWVFRAPPGSREVEEFSFPSRGAPPNPFTGKPAIDFTLKDLAGRTHSLKRLRGKVVLIDFWATWCGPCRITMPRIAKIHEEYKNRGVEVMSINVGETTFKAQSYMKKNGYRFTTLLDQDRAVSSRYQVNGIPTLVVIDRAGTVSDYLVGAHDEVTLRAALAKAGVE